MNKKITTLAERAGFVLWQDETWNPGDQIDWSARYDEELNTFARLLVQHCAQHIQDLVDQRIPASEYPQRLVKLWFDKQYKFEDYLDESCRERGCMAKEYK